MLKDLKPQYIGTVNFSESFRREESAAKKNERKLKLLIFACPFLLYRENCSAVHLPFSIGTIQLHHHGIIVLHSEVHYKMGEVR